MSYTSDVKNEAIRSAYGNDDEIYAEICAIFRVAGCYSPGAGGLRFELVTENPAFARRIFNLAKKFYRITSNIDIKKNTRLRQRNTYTTVIENGDILRDIAENMRIEHANGTNYHFRLPEYVIGGENRQKAYLRGAFLAAGSISDPRKTYHLEIKTRDRIVAAEIEGILEGFGLGPRILDRGSSYIVYVKEGEHIKDFLGLIGSYGYLMEFENIRILKEMRNAVNRLVNCETSNLDKTVDAGVRQIEDIKTIISAIGLGSLPDTLAEIAVLRMENEGMSYAELGQLTKDGIGKSGVSHRMKKIEKIASEIRESKSGKSRY